MSSYFGKKINKIYEKLATVRETPNLRCTNGFEDIKTKIPTENYTF